MTDTTRNQHYTMTPADFSDGCFIRTDVVTGLRIGTGENSAGIPVTLTLDVPLCVGCDQPVPSHGYCSQCDCLHADIAAEHLTETHGDPMLRRRAA
jgi:hypothetical protein